MTRERVEKKSAKPLIVRVNALGSGFIEEDIAAICQSLVFAIMAPKLSSRQDLVDVSQLILDAEKRNEVDLGPIMVISLIESALAVENAYHIVSTQTEFTRFLTLAFGAADFSHDLGVDMTRESFKRQYPQARLTLACHAASLAPLLDSPYMVNLKDTQGLEEDTLTAKRLAFGWKMCVHPVQVEIINKVFSYTQNEIDQAQKILAAFQNAELEGKGAIQLDGEFIDIALIRKARRVLSSSGTT